MRESALGHDGSFYFPAEWGTFLLLVLADDPKGPFILDSRTVVVGGDEVVTIDLGNPSRQKAK